MKIYKYDQGYVQGKRDARDRREPRPSMRDNRGPFGEGYRDGYRRAEKQIANLEVVFDFTPIQGGGR